MHHGEHALHQVKLQLLDRRHIAQLLADQRLLDWTVHLHDADRGLQAPGDKLACRQGAESRCRVRTAVASTAGRRRWGRLGVGADRPGFARQRLVGLARTNGFNRRTGGGGVRLTAHGGTP